MPYNSFCDAENMCIDKKEKKKQKRFIPTESRLYIYKNIKVFLEITSIKTINSFNFKTKCATYVEELKHSTT